MVDRIVPATTAEDKARISNILGVKDAWPVVAEPFFQWVVEDKFPLGRPQWQHSGVEFVSDVAPFERMKLRLLNGAHTAIAAIGQVAGFETVSETIAAPAVRSFLRHYWRQVALTLDGTVDPARYSERLMKRFANPALNHRTAQIASDASQKVPQRVLASLAELITDKKEHDALVYAVAAWIRSCADKNESGASLLRNDPAFHAWNGRPADADAAATVTAFLDFSVVFGRNRKSDPALVRELTTALQNIRQYGILAALDRAFGQPKE
jgi:fructuronate reductase